MPAPGFVSVAGTGFELDGRPFSIAGANCYYLAYCPPDKPQVLNSVLDLAAAFGVNVLRIWAFLDLPASDSGPPRTGQWGACFQYFDRQQGRVVQVSGPDGLGRLDLAVEAAAARGLKLILTLINSLADYGGMDQYLSWLSPPASAPHHDEFYDREDVCAAYQEWIRFLLNREIGNTGRAYRDEPAILAWELANEPRCTAAGNLPARPDCPKSGRIEAWIARMSAYVKSIDRNHLVTTGDEGFFKRGFSCNHLYNGGYGVDCEAILRIPTVDFGTYHLYPQSWGQDAAGFGDTWIAQHLRLARKAGKPVLLEEFGLEAGKTFVTDVAVRDATYAEWLRASRGSGGALVWMLAGVDPDGRPYPGDPFCLFHTNDAPQLIAQIGSREGAFSV